MKVYKKEQHTIYLTSEEVEDIIIESCLKKMNREENFFDGIEVYIGSTHDCKVELEGIASGEKIFDDGKGD